MEKFKDFDIKITDKDLYNSKVADVELSLTFSYRDVLNGNVYIELDNGETKHFWGEHSSDDYEQDYGFTIIVAGC